MKRIMTGRPHHSCLVCNIFSALLAIAVGAPLTWWSLDRQPAYSVEGGTPHTVTIRDAKGSPATAIDIVWTMVTVHRKGCSAIYSREVEDSIGHIYTFKFQEGTFVGLPVGVSHNVHSLVPWEFPDGINEGQIKMRSRITTICNPVQILFPVKSVSPDVTYTIQENPLAKRLNKQGLLSAK